MYRSDPASLVFLRPLGGLVLRKAFKPRGHSVHTRPPCGTRLLLMIDILSVRAFTNTNKDILETDDISILANAKSIPKFIHTIVYVGTKLANRGSTLGITKISINQYAMPGFSSHVTGIFHLTAGRGQYI